MFDLKNNKEYLLNRISSLYTTKYVQANKTNNLTLENNKKILALKDKYKGKRCFIIGGSPSLKLLDLTKLNDEYTFTTNRGYLLENQGLKHSNFHVMSDVRTFTVDHVENEINKDFSDLFLIYAGIDFPFDDKVVFYDFKYATSQSLNENFDCDLTKPLLACSSVILLVIQIACYLGFDKVYLIGVDMDYDNNQGHVYAQTEGEAKRQSDDNNQNAINFVLNSIEAAGKNMNKAGKNLYNASPKGIVDCIERVKFEDLF